MYFTVFYRGIMLFAWSVLILTLLLTPMPYCDGLETVTYRDKVVHALIFGVLSFLIFYLLKGCEDSYLLAQLKKSKIKRRDKKPIFIYNAYYIFILSFIISSSYSFILEWGQSYVPCRTNNEQDFIASIVGIVLVLLFVYGDNYYKKT